MATFPSSSMLIPWFPRLRRGGARPFRGPSVRPLLPMSAGPRCDRRRVLYAPSRLGTNGAAGDALRRVRGGRLVGERETEARPGQHLDRGPGLGRDSGAGEPRDPRGSGGSNRGPARGRDGGGAEAALRVRLPLRVPGGDGADADRPGRMGGGVVADRGARRGRPGQREQPLRRGGGAQCGVCRRRAVLGERAQARHPWPPAAEAGRLGGEPAPQPAPRRVRGQARAGGLEADRGGVGRGAGAHRDRGPRGAPPPHGGGDLAVRDLRRRERPRARRGIPFAHRARARTRGQGRAAG